MKIDNCGIVFPKDDFVDDNGCLKKDCHNDAHIFRTKSGKLIQWEYDESCNCGCWDRREESNGMEQPCIVYEDQE